MSRPTCRIAERLGVLALTMLIVWGCARFQAGPEPPTPPARPESERVDPRIVEFQEMSLELPGLDWQRDEAERSGLDIRRGPPGRQPQTIAVWSVDIPASRRDSSAHEHASRHFDLERRAARSEGRGEGFVQGHRAIEGRLYPVMTDRATYPDRGVVSDRLLLLYFPDDFKERQRFYVVMWVDFHLEKERARPLDELDAVVSSFRVKPISR